MLNLTVIVDVKPDCYSGCF